MTEAVQTEAVPTERVDFRASPDRYKHWRLSTDGPVATLTMDVDEQGGLMPGYELKLNSYDLGVDIELYDAVQRLRFEHPEVRTVVITSGKPKMRSVPSRRSRIAAGVSRHTVRRPTRSELSQLSAAVRIRACLAAFSSTPSRANTSMKADVQASPPVRRTSSPSTVNSTLRALSVPAA